MSFNEISSLNGLSKISSTLKELYVSKNEVAKMEELNHLVELQILELGSNRLRVTDLKFVNNRKSATILLTQIICVRVSHLNVWLWL